jgi:hypothetical protein
VGVFVEAMQAMIFCALVRYFQFTMWLADQADKLAALGELAKVEACLVYA